ncbi:septum formation inhibitor Maf [Psychromonas sp. MB-3u-54]|uniref:Maf family protein n=1 Tax=Psychromonas sp. MB-3u-54 TaxID=2058319 RepID=UPI000C32E667|nr:Maf family protein [Psychromonas sp. MB-3u-54]PKH02973.1 septum formation inhibitor Maf [Psychromonas sp. MB-3u-54]
MGVSIYLASSSPRRSELLSQIGVSFDLVKADIEEKPETGEAAQDYVLRLALQKAQAGFKNSNKDRPVLGADTIIVIDQKILEKPRDKKHARKMLQLLSGRVHQVFTAVALVQSIYTKSTLVKTEVSFKTLSEQEISDYWRSGEPVGKAAGYAIQGIAGKFINNISGSYSGVVGLPLFETAELLGEFMEAFNKGR